MKKLQKKDKFKVIRAVVDIHCDGDLYVKGKDKVFHYVGFLIDENTPVIVVKNNVVSIPVLDSPYKKTRKVTGK